MACRSNRTAGATASTCGRSLFASSLDELGVPWVRLTGSSDERLARVVAVCEELLDQHFRYAPPLG